MKYGLYYFKNTHNLGDDIWAYAQSLFYPHIDYLIDNTTVYNFKSSYDEDVATIIGAFVEPRNREWCFMPPANIIPLFVGAYFRSTMWEFIQNDNIRRYMNAWAPVGTRTISNAERFAGLGIDAYFSGCVTLTLPRLEKKNGDYICLVDVPDFVENHIRKIVEDKIEIRVMTHDLPNIGQDVYLMHRNLSIEERFRKVQHLIQTYADAKFVVTSKLHCALPCLTQSTPVLLTLPKDGKGIVDMYDRMGCYLDFFHICWYEDFKADKVDYDFLNPPQNPEKFVIYREMLIDRIHTFISQCESGKIQRKYVFNEGERLEELTEILENKVFQLKTVIDSKNQVIAEKIGGILALQKRLRNYESFNEWENIEFFSDWSDRSKKMAEFIDDACTSLLDIGCGEMHISNFLDKNVRYFGCDYKKRDENTIICDLSVGEFPDIDVDVCFMAGVLEYLKNWQEVLTNMALHCKQIIISYSTSEAAVDRDPRWVNNIPEKEFVEFIESQGFVLKEKKEVTVNSIGFNFTKEMGKMGTI